MAHFQQCDKMGRMFDYWIIAYFFGKLKKWPKSLDYSFKGQSFVLILTTRAFGYILGDFSQTHPVTLISNLRHEICFEFMSL
jgi:hypothetical protein